MSEERANDIEVEEEEFYDPVAEAKKYREEREALYEALTPRGTSEVKEYKHFTKEEREAHQLIWEHNLDSYCRRDSYGCQPCDNGMPCDSCQYDIGLKLTNAEDCKRLGQPLTPDYNEALTREVEADAKAEREDFERYFYED